VNPAVTIRASDVATAVALSRQIPEFDDPYPAGIYHSRLAGKLHRVLVAQAGGQPIGFKVGYERSGFFYSWMGGVLPAWRGQGVADALADAQEEWARRQGFDRIRLKTRNRHRAMILLAIRRGFDVLSVEPRETVPEYRIWMEKQL